jgi:N-glycosylase/DNA lyase
VIVSLSKRLEPTQAEIVAFKFNVVDYQLTMAPEAYDKTFNLCFTENEKELIGRCMKKRIDEDKAVEDLQELMPLFTDYIYPDNQLKDGQIATSNGG